jgi:hypothetical protein
MWCAGARDGGSEAIPHPRAVLYLATVRPTSVRPCFYCPSGFIRLASGPASNDRPSGPVGWRVDSGATSDVFYNMAVWGG